MISVLLWGCGKRAREILTNCRTLDEYDIIGIVDNDVNKIGGTFMDYSVLAPSYLLEHYVDKIVILADCFSEIRDQIISLNYSLKNRIENKYFFYKESLLKRYAETSDTEICDVLDYVKENGLDYFNYSFKEKYLEKQIDVLWDDSCSMYYLMHRNNKMYFPRCYQNVQQVKDYYISLLIEQDMNSPHHYLDEQFFVEKGDVVVDVGAAEGMFSLDVIDIVSKVYVIEADTKWVEALHKTFEPFAEKVVIIEKYISSYDEGCFARLDSIIYDSPNFIKMDIEGNEWDALRGAKQLIHSSDKLKIAACCYHSDFDEVLIESFFDEIGIQHETTKGYIWFPGLVRQNYVSSSLSRAVVRGYK